MHLSVLRLRHFRNLGVQELAVPREGVAIIGPNAQGKTNLLESIYFLETFRSFRGAALDQMTAFGEGGFRLEAEMTDDSAAGGPLEVTAAYRSEGRRRKITVDGVEATRVGDALGTIAAVVFAPADLAIVSGGPDGRRRFLDMVLSLNRPGYLEALQRYRHALSQRNAALRAGQPASVVVAWDGTLVDTGTRVMQDRETWLSGWAAEFDRLYERISDGRTAALRYVPRVTPGAWSEQGVRDALAEAFDASWSRDARLRSTSVGPHRDDFKTELAEGGRSLDLRKFGSGGQRRTAAFALRLIEAATVRECRGRAPLLLMDDVFAELDDGRGHRILELLDADDVGQVILTAPKESDVRVRRDSLARWRITEGRVWEAA